MGRRAHGPSPAPAQPADAGTRFRYTLSEAATVTIAIERRSKGRRRGRRCVKPSPRLRRRKTCVRYMGRGKLTVAGTKGANSMAFSGRIGRRALPTGSYRALLTAKDAAGNVSAQRTLSFKIVPPLSLKGAENQA